MRKLPFGTAEREVLLKLTSPDFSGGTWTIRNGISLYESRAWTDRICQALVRHGLLNESLKDGVPVYTVNQAGKARARAIRGGRSTHQY